MSNSNDRSAVKGLTIDGQFSKDLDDAIWIEPKGSGWTIDASIADVSSNIPLDSDLDQAAQRRACTRYFARGNDPMLPRELSEGALSLLPGKERQTITIRIELDSGLEIISAKIMPTLLVSEAKMSYELVDAVISGDIEHESFKMLRLANTVTAALLEKRRLSGALAIYDIFSGWVTTEEGFLKKVVPEERHLANIIIQEFMILANNAVATYAAAHDIKLLYRNHTAKTVGTARGSFLSDLDDSVTHPDKFPVATLQSRIALVLNRATYDPFLRGHYGLNLPAYLHFTSPIRRYADLINHRILLAHLQGVPSPYTNEKLTEISAYLTSVDHELRDAKSKSFKEAEHLRTERRIESSQFARLAGADFHKVIKIASQSGQMTPDLGTAVISRLKSDQLQTRDLYYLLLEASQTTEGWISIKKEAFRWIAARPEHAMSLFFLANQNHTASTPQFSVEASGEAHATIFTGAATVEYRGQKIVSAHCTARSKKEAQQLMCVSALQKILAEVQHIAVVWEPISPEKRGVLSAIETEPTADKTSNPKNQLLELCQEQKWPMPEFVVTAEGPDHMKTFTAQASIRVMQVKLTSDACRSGSKKEAEKLASASLLQKLTPLAAKHAAPATVPTETNYVSILQEWLVARGKPLPSYGFVQDGPSHSPTIACTCTLGLAGTLTLTEIAKGPNNKSAKQKAAAQMYKRVIK